MTSKAQRTKTQINMFDEAQATADNAENPAADDNNASAGSREIAAGAEETNGTKYASRRGEMGGFDDTLGEAPPTQELIAENAGGQAVEAEEPVKAKANGAVEDTTEIVSDERQATCADGPVVTVPDPGAEPATMIASDPATLPAATLGEVRLVPLGALSIAFDNVWGRDIVRDEHFRRLQALAASAAIEPLLVEAAGNGWAIIGDPGPYLALVEAPGVTANTMVPIREITGSKAAIACHLGRAALLGRPFRNMRRARYTLTLCEIGVQGAAIASSLGLAGSAASRDIKAARMERQYPAFAGLLASPSEAPVSYYLDIADHADRQPAPAKAMAVLAATAARLARAGTLSPVGAKAALGVTRKPPALKAPKAANRRYLDPAIGAETVAVEPTGDGKVRLVLTFPGGSEPLDAQAARYAEWLRTLAPPACREG